MTLGLANDAEYLYVSLVPGSEALQRQILGQGLTHWFRPEGREDAHLGIRFPVGLRPERTRPASGHQLRLPTEQAEGLEVVARFQGEGLVYELKVPLTETSRHP